METDQEKKPLKKVLAHDPFSDVEEELWVNEEPLPTPEPAEEPPVMPDDDDFAFDAMDALEAELLGEMVDEELDGIPTDEPENSGLDDLIAAIDSEMDALHSMETGIDLAGEETAVTGTTEQHIIFNLADVDYAIPIGSVIEIGRPLPITTVPNAPNWMLGVANLRGDIISMVDLRGFLGLPATGIEQDGRMLVAQSDTEEITIGLIVDRVSGIAGLRVNAIGAPTAPIEDQIAPYLRGVYEQSGRLLVVLDLNKLLLSTEMQQFEPI